MAFIEKKVFVFQPASIGSGQYTFDLYFQNPAEPQFTNLNDVIRDSVGNLYRIINPTSIPLLNGSTVTTEFVSNDVLPTEDTDYNSVVYDPNVVDRKPAVRTSGALAAPTIYSGPNFEWTVTSGWTDPAEADKAVVGDFITDFSGKMFMISFLDPINRFNDPIRITEVDKEGKSPAVGEATIYRPTSNFKMFQGTALTDQARIVALNRDNQLSDTEIKTAQSTGGSGGGVNIKQMQNTSGVTIPAGKPVSKRADGGIMLFDSDASQAQNYIGISSTEMLPTQLGDVILVGPNIVGALSGLGFAPGQDVFLGENPGEYVGEGHVFADSNDSIIKVGIADNAAGTASPSAPDLVMFQEVILRP